VEVSRTPRTEFAQRFAIPGMTRFGKGETGPAFHADSSIAISQE
jgi:hypothetical protein